MLKTNKGSLMCTPALTAVQVSYLHEFCTQAKFKHDNSIIKEYSDPLRHAVGLPLGNDGEYYTGSLDYRMNQKVFMGNHPSFTCPWQPSANGKRIRLRNLTYDRQDKHSAWLQYLQQHFLNRWGIALHGAVVYRYKNVVEGAVIANGDIECFSPQEFKQFKTAQQQRQNMLDEIGGNDVIVARKKAKL